MHTKPLIMLVTLALAATAGAGCLEDLPQPSHVEGLRVLGIQASRPEVGAGESTSLEALVVDTRGRDIELSWVACVLPERGLGVFQGSGSAANSGGGGYAVDDVGTCHELQAVAPERVWDLGSGNPVTLKVPDDFLDDLSVVGEYYGLPTDLLSEPLAAGILAIAGVNITVSLRVTAGGEVLETFKRVNVSLAFPPNENPKDVAVALVSSGEADPPETVEAPDGRRCFADGPRTWKPAIYRFEPQNLPDPPPTYQVLTGTTSPERPFDLLDTDESLFYSFFSTHGTFGRDVVNGYGAARGTWDLRGVTADRAIPLWIVVRDGRGGTSWCHSVLEPATD